MDGEGVPQRLPAPWREARRGLWQCAGGFTCPFHGWCWGTDGANTFLYQPDLFAEGNREPDDLALQEVGARPGVGARGSTSTRTRRRCASSSSRSPPSTTRGRSRTCGAEWWLSCVLPTNWKLAMEAFMEGYHVMQTHPQLLRRSPRDGSVPCTALWGPTTRRA